MFGFVNQPNASAISEYETTANGLDINISPDSEPFGGVLATNPNETAVTGNATSSAAGESGAASSTATATGSDASDSGSAKGTATSTSASASGTGNGTSGADAMSFGAGGGVLALMMALMAA